MFSLPKKSSDIKSLCPRFATAQVFFIGFSAEARNWPCILFVVRVTKGTNECEQWAKLWPCVAQLFPIVFYQHCCLSSGLYTLRFCPMLWRVTKAVVPHAPCHLSCMAGWSSIKTIWTLKKEEYHSLSYPLDSHSTSRSYIVQIVRG